MAELEVQPWKRWRARGPMQVLGELDHGVYARLAAAGWAWDEHEEEWDQFPEGTKVLLLARGGVSRFMLEAVPSAPEVGVRVWGPGDEERQGLADEVLRGLALAGESMTLDVTWPDDDDVDPATDADLLSAAERAPFALFGLSDDFRGTRKLNGVGHHGEVVDHVTLSHGLWTDARVDVSVTRSGPTVDPLPSIATELLGRSGVRITSGADLAEAWRKLLVRGFEDGELRVDGEPWPFRFLRDGAHWAALHDLEPDHLLYIVASNVEPSEIALTRLENLSAYA